MHSFTATAALAPTNPRRHLIHTPSNFINPLTLFYPSSQLTSFFSFSSITYVLISVPIGWVVDRYPNNIFVFKTVQSLGLFLLFLTFALLGPVKLTWFGLPQSIENSLNSVGCVVAAMILKGIGSAGNAAAYPDLVARVPEGDDALTGFISGLWNAAYAVGWAAGPLVGGTLYQHFHEIGGGATGDSVGFDAFATIVSAASLGYAVILFLVGCLTLKCCSCGVLCCKSTPKEEPVRQPLLDVAGMGSF